MELDAGNNNSKEYKVKTIRNSAIYAQDSESSQLTGLYYLVSWKGYPEEENSWEPYLAIKHLGKLISLFHKDHPDKLTIISKAINTALPMVRPTIKPTTKIATGQLKQKRVRLTKDASKRTRRNWAWFL